jgi:hypothetical protein
MPYLLEQNSAFVFLTKSIAAGQMIEQTRKLQ